MTKRCPYSICGNLRTSAANTARSTQSRRGVGLALRSTVTSWRSTRSSTCLDADARATTAGSAAAGRSGRADATTRLTIMPRRAKPTDHHVRSTNRLLEPTRLRADAALTDAVTALHRSLRRAPAEINPVQLRSYGLLSLIISALRRFGWVNMVCP